MFKKITTVFLLICLLWGVCACSTDSGLGKSKKETIKFDLSQYEDHGVLSCGLVWVTKEVSDWNKEPEVKFAYLDAEGNIKSPWFSLNKYREAVNFTNGYVILIERSVFKEGFDYSKCVVYNTEFKEIAKLNCRILPNSSAVISNFDTQGDAYAVGYDSSSDDVLYWIDRSGAHKFEKTDSGSLSLLEKNDLNRFKRVFKSNNYFVIISGSNNPEYLYTTIACIYDGNGRLVLDIEAAMRKRMDDFAITSAEILDEKSVKFYFYGANKKRYVCTMNFKGDFIKSPKEA